MYLKKIGNTYYFNARVPKDLVQALGVKELKKSLRTSNRKTARTAAKAYALELERMAVYVRSGFMDDKQLQRALQRLKDGFLRGVEDVRDAGENTFDVLQQQASGKSIPGLDVNYDFWQMVSLFGYGTSRIDTPRALEIYTRLANSVKEELIPGSLYSDATRRDAFRFVQDNNLAVDIPPAGWFDENDDAWFAPVKGDFKRVITQLLKTKQELYDVEIQRLKGNYQNPYDAQPRTQQTQYLLSQAIDDFCRERQADKGGEPRTNARYREYFNVMLTMLGDRDVIEYSRRDLDDLKANLYNRPANASKNPKNPKLLDKRTVNTNYMGKISSLFRWLHLKDYVQKDLTPGLVSSLTAKEKRDRKRKAYDGDDLRKIFDLLPFDTEQPHIAWVPLLAAYTGARQNEICQLLVTDIKEEGDIFFLSITEVDDKGNVVKNLKNENSIRNVPVHPALIELGFLDYVRRRTAQGKRTVFESRKRDSAGFRPLQGAYYTKLYQAFNRGKITSDPKKVFHSFRHLVQNELKQRGVPEAVYHSIAGHSSDNEMDKVYTDEEVKALAAQGVSKAEIARALKIGESSVYRILRCNC